QPRGAEPGPDGHDERPPDGAGPPDHGEDMAGGAQAREPDVERDEQPVRSRGESRPAAHEDADQPLAARGRQREDAEEGEEDEVHRQEDEGGPLEVARDGDEEEQRREEEADGEPVEHPLHHHGGHRGPEPLSAPRDHIGSDHLAGAEREQVIGHVADHHRIEEAGGPRSGRKQIAPASGAGPERAEVQRGAGGEKAPVRVGEAGADGGQVGTREEIHDEARADREPEEDLEEPSARRHARGQRPERSGIRPLPGSWWWARPPPAAGRWRPAPRACRARGPRGSSSPPAPPRAARRASSAARRPARCRAGPGCPPPGRAYPAGPEPSRGDSTQSGYRPWAGWAAASARRSAGPPRRRWEAGPRPARRT